MFINVFYTRICTHTHTHSHLHTLTHTVRMEVGAREGGYIHNVVLHKGWLFKRTHGTVVASNFQYRKRYFELSNAAILYAQNEKKSGVGGIKGGVVVVVRCDRSYPVD